MLGTIFLILSILANILFCTMYLTGEFKYLLTPKQKENICKTIFVSHTSATSTLIMKKDDGISQTDLNICERKIRREYNKNNRLSKELGSYQNRCEYSKDLLTKQNISYIKLNANLGNKLDELNRYIGDNCIEIK